MFLLVYPSVMKKIYTKIFQQQKSIHSCLRTSLPGWGSPTRRHYIRSSWGPSPLWGSSSPHPAASRGADNPPWGPAWQTAQTVAPPGWTDAWGPVCPPHAHLHPSATAGGQASLHRQAGHSAYTGLAGSTHQTSHCFEENQQCKINILHWTKILNSTC